MRKIIEKLILILLIAILGISINIKTYADSNKWLDAQKDIDSIAKFVNEKTTEDLLKASDDGKITNKWDDECRNKILKDEKLKKFIEVQWNNWSSTLKDNDKTIKQWLGEYGVKDKDLDKYLKYVRAYEKLEQWEGAVEAHVEEKEQSKQLEKEDTINKYKKMSVNEMIETYAKRHSLTVIKNSKEGTAILKKWYEVIVTNNEQSDKKNSKVSTCKFSGDSKHNYNDERYNLYQELKKWKEDEEKKEDADTIYKNPIKTSDTNGSEQSLEDMLLDADSFVNEGKVKYNETSLQNFSKTFYNIMLTVGIFVAVIIGAFLGIKLMTSSAEGQAEVKKLLVPYVVGCVVVFGGFTIWKIVVTLLEQI